MGTRVRQYLVVTGALAAALCLLLLSVTADRAQALPAEGIFVPDQIIIKLTPGTEIGEINDRYDTQVKERFLDRADTDIYLLEITDGSSTEVKLDEIKNDPLITYAELNFFAEAPEAASRHRAFPAGDAKPTDEHYSKFSYEDLSTAHQFSKGKGTKVAVLDTGAQLGHPALTKNFEGVARHDFVDDDKDPSEPRFARNKDDRENEVVGHGTHVAGIVDLVAPRAEIMPLRVLNRRGYGTVFHVAEAISFAYRNGADVINLSLGTPSRSQLLRETIKEAIGDGAVIAAAAGNLSTIEPDPPKPIYPAAGDGVAVPDDGLLAVTSVDKDEMRSLFANYGLWVDIAAPGENILSTYPVSRYAYWSGTSMAAPFLSGQAALIHSVKGSLKPADIEKTIRCSARPVSGDPTLVGVGQTDVGASLQQSSDSRCLSP